MSESLEEITTSNAVDPAEPGENGENTETTEETVEPEIEQPDGFALRDAKIATLEMEKAQLDALVTQLRAHNYELLMAAGAGQPTENSGDNPDNDGDDPESFSGGVDDLIASRG